MWLLMPTSKTTSLIRRSLAVTSSLFVLLTLIVATVVFTRRIATPFASLTATVTRLAAGDYAVPVQGQAPACV